MTSVVPRGITVSLGAFCLFYALVSFLLSLLVSTALFVVLGTAFVALVSYYRLPPPPRHAVEAVLGVDYTAYKTATDEPHRSVAGASDEDTKGSQQLILPVVAHRGACLDAPENSLTAFRLVKQRGVHCVELDVSMTKDGVPIIFHDDFVDRVTNGTGRVTDLTFAEIQKLELSSKFIFPDKYPDEKIPTLAEALELCLELDLRIMIDVKDPNPAVAYAVVAEFRRLPELKAKALVSSFFPNIIYIVRSQEPDVVCSMAVRPSFFAYQDYVRGVGPVNPRFDVFWKHWAACFVDNFLEWSQFTFTPYFLGLSVILASVVYADCARVTHWRNQGLRVFIWTVNDPVAKKYCNDFLRVPYLTDTLEI